VSKPVVVNPNHFLSDFEALIQRAVGAETEFISRLSPLLDPVNPLSDLWRCLESSASHAAVKPTTVPELELYSRSDVDPPSKRRLTWVLEEALLWLIGVPLPIILLLAVFMHH